MPENKKQHYVPKFYLKLFSNNDGNTHIGLYNFKSKKLVKEAGINNQAYENFFYGKDGKIEEGFSKIENHTKILLKQVVDNMELPRVGSEDYSTLFLFTFLQASRTKNAAKEANEMLDLTIKAIFKDDPRVKDHDMDSYRFEMSDPVHMNLQTLIDTIEVAQDLKCKLLVNESDVPFITSDHPIVRYNQFLEKRKFPGGWAGLATKGLQVFYPISPSLAIMFYDSRVYKIGFKKQNAVVTSNSNDINSLNLLQSLNCDENIYFSNKTTEYQVQQLSFMRERFINRTKGNVNEYKGDTKTDGSTSSIIHSFNHNHETKLQLSFIKETDHAKGYKLTGYAVELRNEKYRNVNNIKGISI
ncbi:MAG: DUF4238 domain-containing protein [Bacteroidia bacterium]